MCWSSYSICLIVFLISRALTAKTVDFELSNGRRAAVSVINSNSANDEWIVFLQGSGCSIYDPYRSKWIAWLQEKHLYNVLVVNKAGAAMDGTCRETEFQFSSLRQQRINDIRSVLSDYLPANANVILFGESEGGYIAPDIAVEDTRVVSLILISGGTKNWIEEEVMLAPTDKRTELLRFFKSEVIGNLTLEKFYDETSYALFNSYNNHQSFQSLQRLKVPALFLEGDQDKVIWVEGVPLQVAI
jgi:pimeloyl-ACP methyl ester carboxylesterase